MRVTIVEVGPRDGLQNEPAMVPTADKIAFVDLLSAAGLPVIEVSAFVSPKWIPAMADAGEVFAGITRRPGVRYTALVPNLAGLDRAHAAGVTEVAIFAAASETFSRKNINQAIDASLVGYRQVCEKASSLGVRVRAYVSTAFGCPFEGPVPPERVAAVSHALIEMGAFEVSVSDTIGVAHPGQVPVVVGAVAARVPLTKIALHFHDTRGTALANVLTALDLGVTTFDASAGGLGGCPYAPGATGNLATEDLIYMLDGLGIETGVNLDALVTSSAFVESRIGHRLPSRYYRAVRT
jgi:isopropylmalate/homocitrate/citramalate synthase